MDRTSSTLRCHQTWFVGQSPRNVQCLFPFKRPLVSNFPLPRLITTWYTSYLCQYLSLFYLGRAFEHLRNPTSPWFSSCPPSTRFKSFRSSTMDQRMFWHVLTLWHTDGRSKCPTVSHHPTEAGIFHLQQIFVLVMWNQSPIVGTFGAFLK